MTIKGKPPLHRMATAGAEADDGANGAAEQCEQDHNKTGVGEASTTRQVVAAIFPKADATGCTAVVATDTGFPGPRGSRFSTRAVLAMLRRSAVLSA